MAITTTSEYKAYRGLTSTLYDTPIGTLVTAAEQMVARYVRGDSADAAAQTTLESAERTEDYRGGDGAIWLRCWPVSDVASVSQVWSDGSTTVLPTSAYQLDGRRGCLDAVGGASYPWTFDGEPRRSASGGPTWPQGTIRVTYTGGYATIPADLKLAVWLMLDHLIGSRGVDKLVASESMGTLSRTLMGPTDQAMAIRNMLGPYRRGEYGV